MKDILLLIFSCVLLSSSCRKNHLKRPLDELPPETQEGKNTFGCLINGKAFKPGGSSLAGPVLQANYQLIYFNSPTGYILGITARDRSSKDIRSVSIGFDSLIAEQGRKYQLSSILKGNAGGQYSFYPSTGKYQVFQTKNFTSGELCLKKFNLTQQIASGTFWFNAVSEEGDTVKITDGRFDVRFTR